MARLLPSPAVGPANFAPSMYPSSTLPAYPASTNGYSSRVAPVAQMQVPQSMPQVANTTVLADRTCNPSGTQARRATVVGAPGRPMATPAQVLRPAASLGVSVLAAGRSPTLRASGSPLSAVNDSQARRSDVLPSQLPRAATVAQTATVGHGATKLAKPLQKQDNGSAKASNAPAKAGDLNHLLLLLRNPKILSEWATRSFRKSDTDGNGVLSRDELEALIPLLHEELGLAIVDDPEELRQMVGNRMRKYDINGDGVLNEQEFLELYKWTLWLKYEELDPPKMRRSSLVGEMHAGNPSQFYEIGQRLGQGQFGVVNLARHRESGLNRVLKTINKQMAVQAGTPLAMLSQEIEILALLDHPHILRLYEHYNDTRNIYIITDVCYGGDLLAIVQEHCEARRPLPEAWVATVFRQALEAIGYCHSKGVMHKDLKFENLMLHQEVTCDSPLEDINVVVIDVGLSELFGKQHRKGVRSNIIAGSPATMAPEVIRRDFSFACDIWSFGCLLYAIFNVQPAFLPDGAGGQVLYTYPFAPVPTEEDRFGLAGMLEAQSRGPPLEQIQTASREAQEVVLSMLSFDERMRPNASECLALPWFCGHCPPTAFELSEAQVQALLNDREVNIWRRTVTLEAATQLPVSACMELEKEFEAMASSSGGTSIECSALAEALVKKGVAQDVAEKVADVADMDRSGMIEWTEFVAAMLPACHELFAELLQSIFQEYDVNHDGYLDSNEVALLLQHAQVQLHLPKNKAVEMMIKELDANHDGRISFSEFHDYLLNTGSSL